MSDPMTPQNEAAPHLPRRARVNGHVTTGARWGLIAKQMVDRLSRLAAAACIVVTFWLCTMTRTRLYNMEQKLTQVQGQITDIQQHEGTACDALWRAVDGWNQWDSAADTPSAETIKSPDQHSASGSSLTTPSDEIVESPRQHCPSGSSLTSPSDEISHYTPETEEVRRLLQEAIKQCTKDKSGRRDYAFLQSGGYVISTLTSKSFTFEPFWLKLGKALRFQPREQPAEIALKGDGSIGNCWPFAGSMGQLGIGLSRPIKIDGVSIEHIGAELAQEDIDSAPKHFELWGVTADSGHTLLHQGVYNISYPSTLQTFDIIEDPQSQIYGKVILKILSNHGNPNFTCLYRVRIHGKDP